MDSLSQLKDAIGIPNPSLQEAIGIPNPLKNALGISQSTPMTAPSSENTYNKVIKPVEDTIKPVINNISSFLGNKLNNNQGVQNINNNTVNKNIPLKPSKYLGVDDNKLGQSISNTEGFAGNENNFKSFLQTSNPSRLNEPERNKYGDAGKFGWTVGFTKDTYNDLVRMAKTGDSRYVNLLKKIDLDSSPQAAQKSAVELLKFKNTLFDSNGKPIGNKYNNLKDAYVNTYNASGTGKEQAKKNWINNSGL